ncbi:Cation/H+ exchanger [Gilbertella persicaria]|uniref:Cation/H+ exchanger n=1 Tax=Gilbertella persicaria TaxID=101096 RepID=UPI002220AEFB|nr:Cation/H+ exchanger [Gilbertella persicaria]KAI8047734.1 Cation/H+ exchanger [Gilbertella persicaria]
MEVETISIVIFILGGFILLFGLTSLVIKERLYISEASVAIACGIIFGPLCANFINVESWGDEDMITKQFCRIVIGIQVMAVGVALPKAYLRKEIVSLAMLLLPIMIYMWLMSGLLVWGLIPGVNFLESLMIAACFTPTDPVLANSVVQGKFAEKKVPAHVRNLISCESGANDGLGYPFLFLAIYLLQMNTGAAIGKWAYWIMAYNILLSFVIGFVVGYVARKLLKFAEQRKLIDKESFLVFAVALALFLMGGVGLIGSDDLFACFIAGNSFTWNDWFRVETEQAHLMEPWSSFSDAAIQITAWRLVVLAILVLLLRRLPIVLTLYKYIPAIRNWREALFTGWFGPIGVGAIFYYQVAIESVPEDGPNGHARAVMLPVVYFLVLSSVIVHGITVPLFHIGTFAKRTLTRTSEKSQLRLPVYKPLSTTQPKLI